MTLEQMKKWAKILNFEANWEPPFPIPPRTDFGRQVVLAHVESCIFLMETNHAERLGTSGRVDS
jgi:hypothetical protein